jgi:ligand-binding sensor domain-containing protein
MKFIGPYLARLCPYPERFNSVCAGLILALLLLASSCNEQEEGLVSQSDINKWRYFTKNQGLASNYVNAIFEDSKGNVWIGTPQGLSVYNGSAFTNYTTSDGLLDNNIYAIAEDKDGAIWVGTGNGLNVLLDNQWQYFTYFYGAGIYSLLSLQDDQGVLIGTGGYGVYRYSYTDDNFGPFDFTENCEACNSVNSLYQASDGSVWIATFAGARRLKNNKLTRYDLNDGLPGIIATSIAEDSWGNIWVGTVEGKTITKISGNLISQVSFNNGANQNFIFGIQEADDGNLWVGTVANGLFYYDGAIMSQIYEGPPDNTITVLTKDRRGNLWIGTSQGGLAQYVTNPL